jgi:hypothetical protein
MSIERFMKTYSNLPFKIREEIVIVFEGEPISWNIAYQEIVHGTEKGKKIMTKLIELNII